MAEWKTTDPDDANSVKSYFQRFRSVTERLEKSKSSDKLLLNDFFSDEMQRITDLSNALDEFDEKSTNFEQPVKLFLECLNGFLKDSGKALTFDKTNNQLFFCSLNDTKGTYQSLAGMSSGERQILILLTYIAFPPKNNNLFVIDEPELSLHPKWQHQFLRAVERLMHPDAQLIIATHSPEIVGRYKEHCVEL
jgi:predicted ATPase